MNLNFQEHFSTFTKQGPPRPEFRNLKGRNSPIWGDCFFSVDLIANEITATGGHWRFVPAPGAWPLDPAKRKNAVGKRKQLSLAALGRTQVRRLLAYRKPGNNPQGRASFPLGIFPAFPGCFAFGLAAESGRARSITASGLAFPSSGCG